MKNLKVIESGEDRMSRGIADWTEDSEEFCIKEQFFSIHMALQSFEIIKSLCYAKL